MVNSYLLIGILAICVVAQIILFVITFIRKPKDEQIADIKEWLVWAVTVAERELGEGTGELKLRYVYDMFVTKFGFVSNLITFEEFKVYVDEALEKFKDLMSNNDRVKEIIETTK